MMAGVVRRDGLREAVTALRDKWVADEGRTWISNCGDELSAVLDAVPDVPPTEHPDFSPENMARLREAALQNLIDTTDVPPTEAVWCHCFGTPEPTGNWVYPNDEHADTCGADVPADPPAADRDALARVLETHRLNVHPGCACGWVMPRNEPMLPAFEAHQAYALLSSGRLVDAADVRARALEDAAAAWDRSDAETWTTPGDYLRDRAVSEREGARALVGDETPGTGEGA